jgi:hypothetical protein
LDKSEEIVFKSHFIIARYIGYTACFLFGCLLSVFTCLIMEGAWIEHKDPWFPLLITIPCSLVFLSSIFLFIWSVNEIVIGLDGITITRFRKRIHISNEMINGIRIFGNTPMYMYIKTHPKDALPLRERIHIFENNLYSFLLLPLKQELLSRYSKQKPRRELPDKVT